VKTGIFFVFKVTAILNYVLFFKKRVTAKITPATLFKAVLHHQKTDNQN
jgi:hypothetical protein